MSFDDYVNHITLKYRLATAIAVLKGKPASISIEEHIAALRNKISDNNMDVDILDVSLESNDFNFDDDITINDNNDLKDNAERESLNYSITILHDVNMNIESNENATHEAESLENVMSLLKGVDENVKTASKTFVNDDMSQRTFCESSQSQSIAPSVEINATDVKMQGIDFNKTHTYETYDLTVVNKNSDTVSKLVKTKQDKRTYGTNFSSHQSDSKDYSENMEPIEHLVKNNKKQRIMAENVLKNICKEPNISVVSRTDIDNANNHQFINITNAVKQTTAENENNVNDYDILIETQLVERNNDMANKVCQNLDKVNQNAINDSQSTILYSLYENTQNFTHVSQSQSQYYDQNDYEKFIHGSKNYGDEYKNTTVTQLERKSKDSDANIANNFDAYDLIGNQMSQNNEPQILNVDSSEIQYIIDKNGRTYCVLEGLSKENVVKNDVFNTNTNMHNLNTEANNPYVASQEIFDTNEIDSHKNAVNLEKIDVNTKNCEMKDKIEDDKQDLEITQDIKDDNIFEDDITSAQNEVIPFKVIEELNKIKTFLNRKIDRRASTDSFSMDSGYRSDSQSKSSFKSALQLTGNTVNQSAHCVYTYLLQCPLVESTKDITLEISTMLGRLIDKLHENEKYPSFLEDILDSIDNLLTDINEGENPSDVIILTKDESIQRFLLLNKSSHVIRYSIEKITSILDKLHTCLNSEDHLYEITNIHVVENICYIFHILEILIKRYRKGKKDNSSSQNSTQNSQDSEGILKKSSITDIWRKKWNPDCKNVKIEGSFDKKCALTNCGVVLNKIIVDGMDGYSIISFAALQCFNLLQS